MPLRIVYVNLDGFAVGDPSRLDQKRRLIIALLKRCDGVCIGESHIRYDNFVDTRDWCNLMGFTLFVDFDPHDKTATPEQQKGYGLAAIFNKSVADRDGLTAGKYHKNLFHNIEGTWGTMPYRVSNWRGTPDDDEA